MIKLNLQRDAGLRLAIAGAGGVGELARRLGLAQPSVSRWRRVPAERIVAVEAASGIPREFLRPDLYRRAPGDWPDGRLNSTAFHDQADL